MYTLYLLTIFIVVLVAFTSIEETLRIIRYVDLQIQYAVVRYKMYRMKRTLEKQMGIPPRQWEKDIDTW